MGAESKIEKRARREIKAAGGLMFKWTSPGRCGVHDNIVFWPGVIHLAEFKAPDKGLEHSQEDIHAQLRALQIPMFVLDTDELVDEYIAQYRPFCCGFSP